MQPRVWCLVRGELRAVWGACSVLTRPGKRWEAADQGTPPVDEPRGECAIKWIPLKVTCSVTPPVEQSGKPGLRNREPGSTVEKLPDGAVNPEKVQLNAGTQNLTFGGNAVKFTGLLLWWLPNLENSTACFKSMPFFWGWTKDCFLVCFLFFPLIDFPLQCAHLVVCVVGVCW